MEKDDRPLEDLIKKAIKDLGKAGRISQEDIASAWALAVGGAAAGHSRPHSLKKSSLVVDVDGSSWLYELTTRKREILKSLGGGLKGIKIKEIRFRIGEVSPVLSNGVKKKGQ